MRGKAIPIIRPWLGVEEARAVASVLKSGWVTQGPQVEAFEREFARSVGAPHACAVSNCTTALHLALIAAGVGRGDEVLTVSHSFIATANAIRHVGAIPVFIDIDPRTYNLDPTKLDNAVSAKTKAILCVHQMGMPCDLEAVVRVGGARGLPVIEDAACAVGSEIRWPRGPQGRWEKIGRPHGDAACFSFHPRKLLTTGDGGMITTRHADWDRRFRLLRHHGMSVPDRARHASREVIFEDYTELGYNYRLTDLQAAVGREQLKRLPRIVRERRARAAEYLRRLAREAPGLGLPHQPEWARSNWQSFCVRLPEGVNQKATMQAALDAGIATRRGIMCAHREPAYKSEPWAARPDGRLPESERAQDHCVLIPLSHDLTRAEMDRVVAFFKNLC